MPKILKTLRIAVDLQSLVDKKIPSDVSTLDDFKPWKGSLGAITVLSDVFDLYLLNSYSELNNEEILKWLTLSESEKYFRNILPITEDLRNFLIQNNISVTITSSNKIADMTKDVSTVYFIKKVHLKDIQLGIHKIFRWRDLVREVTKLSSLEETYDIGSTQTDIPELHNKEPEGTV